MPTKINTLLLQDLANEAQALENQIIKKVHKEIHSPDNCYMKGDSICNSKDYDYSFSVNSKGEKFNPKKSRDECVFVFVMGREPYWPYVHCPHLDHCQIFCGDVGYKFIIGEKQYREGNNISDGYFAYPPTKNRLIAFIEAAKKWLQLYS